MFRSFSGPPSLAGTVALAVLFAAPGSQALASQVVTSLTLINADTNQPIAGYNPMPNAATLDLASLPTKNLNIRANTSPATVGSVRFALNGDSNYRTETAAPYAFAGDTSGNFWPWTPSEGSYSVTATPFSSAGGTGTAGTPLTITFTVQVASSSSGSTGDGSSASSGGSTGGSSSAGDSSGSAVASVTLINADTNQPISGFDPLLNGATLDLSSLPTKNLNIRANTGSATVGSVRFALDGTSDYRTETVQPYALAGDSSGNYAAWTPAVGSHTLTVTPYSGASGTGTAGSALTIAFTVQSGSTSGGTAGGGTGGTSGDGTGSSSGSTLAVTSLTLINADTDQPISSLTSGAVLDLATLPTRNLNVRANTNPTTVGSVHFGLDSNADYRTESGAPYALAGDSAGDYNAWTPSVGSHTIVATPYQLVNGSWTKGTAASVTFTVQDSSSGQVCQ